MAALGPLRLGEQAPDFNLPDVAAKGKMVRLADFAASPCLVVVFLCSHCPFVKHVLDALAQMAAEYAPKGVAVVSISSNDVERFPDDSPDKLARMAARNRLPFPILYDETQEIAHAYHAACTPEFFLFDRNRRLVYRGQFDDSRPGRNVPVSGVDLRVAVEAVLAGKEPPRGQKPATGCHIKWKRGNEPRYFRV